MKKAARGIFLSVLLIMLLFPLQAYAAGEGNVDNGGGGIGGGTSSNFWHIHDEGVRVTVVRASDGSAASASIDLTNQSPDDIRVHFGKVCKTTYRSGAGLTPNTGIYTYIRPGQPLPYIIETSAGASIEAIKRYFTDEQVLRSIAGHVGMNYETMTGGEYKLLLEPVAYVTVDGVRMAFTAMEAAKYDQISGLLQRKMPSLTHKNLPLAMFLEVADLGYPAWGGSHAASVSDEEIIRALGIGIVRFREDVTPEEGEVDYEYRTDTDVITAVTISGGQSDPDNPVWVTFHILGQSYVVSNVFYPEGDQQRAWVRWHTPSTPQTVIITVSVGGGGRPSAGTITAKIVAMEENTPPNPVADDRNDSYNAAAAVMPGGLERTIATWSIWGASWHESWVWHSEWVWRELWHNESCPEFCTTLHGYWEDEGEYVDEGWWEFYKTYHSASLSAGMQLVPDAMSPTAGADTIKSGYGVNIRVDAQAQSDQPSAVTSAQTAVSYFPEFYYQTYFRKLEQTRGGYAAVLEFKSNRYSTYSRRTHFTPVWMPDGNYAVYTYLMDCWTPDGMLCMNLADSVQIHGDLWDDWHIAPQN